MEMSVPLRSIRRLTSLYQTALGLLQQGRGRASSAELESITGIPAATIRKDLQYIGSVGQNGAGYDTRTLADAICERFHLDRRVRACIVGLGNLGQAILNYENIARSGYQIIAGFDANTNKIETLPTEVSLYPTWEMPDIIRRFDIRLGIIAVPAAAAQETADTLIGAGIDSLINFAPVLLNTDREGVIIRNIDIMQEFRIVSALRSLNNEE